MPLNIPFKGTKKIQSILVAAHSALSATHSSLTKTLPSKKILTPGSFFSHSQQQSKRPIYLAQSTQAMNPTKLNPLYSAIPQIYTQKADAFRINWMTAIAAGVLGGGCYAAAEEYSTPKQDPFFENNEVAWNEFLTEVNIAMTTYYKQQNLANNEIISSIFSLLGLYSIKKFPRIYISYAWERDSEANRYLQQRLEQLQDDLAKIGCKVFLDTDGMTGLSPQTMKERLESSDIILLVCTKRYFERIRAIKHTGEPSPEGYEYRAALQKLTDSPDKKCVIPISFSDDSKLFVPGELRELHLYCDLSATNWVNYTRAFAGPGGLLPKILGLPFEEAIYIACWERYQFRQKNFQAYYTRGSNKSILDKINNNWKSSRIQVLQGSGGTGKTSLASEYSARFAQKNSNSFVYWVQARNGAIEASFKTLAISLGITITPDMSQNAIASNVYEILQARPEWLLVFDDAVDYEQIKTYLPSAADLKPDQQILLLTQSDQKWPENIGVTSIKPHFSLYYRGIIRKIAASSKSSEVLKLAIEILRIVAYLDLDTLPERALTICLEPDAKSAQIDQAISLLCMTGLLMKRPTIPQTLIFSPLVRTLALEQEEENGEQSNRKHVISLLNSLGHLALEEEKFSEARNNFEKTIKLYKQFHEDKSLNPIMVDVYHHIALVFEKQASPEKALIYLEKALSLAYQIFGKHHPKVAQILQEAARIKSKPHVDTQDHAKPSL
jgi:hypothetical protein